MFKSKKNKEVKSKIESTRKILNLYLSEEGLFVNEENNAIKLNQTPIDNICRGFFPSELNKNGNKNTILVIKDCTDDNNDSFEYNNFQSNEQPIIIEQPLRTKMNVKIFNNGLLINKNFYSYKYNAKITEKILKGEIPNELKMEHFQNISLVFDDYEKETYEISNEENIHNFSSDRIEKQEHNKEKYEIPQCSSYQNSQVKTASFCNSFQTEKPKKVLNGKPCKIRIIWTGGQFEVNCNEENTLQYVYDFVKKEKYLTNFVLRRRNPPDILNEMNKTIKELEIQNSLIILENLNK